MYNEHVFQIDFKGYPVAFFGRGCTWITFAIPRKQKRITALLKEVMNFQKAFFIRNSSVKLHKS